jgi:hypothetical protein
MQISKPNTIFKTQKNLCRKTKHHIIALCMPHRLSWRLALLEVTHSSSILASRYNPNYAELSRRSDKIQYTENSMQALHRLSWLCYQARLALLEVTHPTSMLASRYNPNYAVLSRRSDKILYLVYCTWDKAPQLVIARKQMGKQRRERWSSLHRRKADLTNVILRSNSKYPSKLTFNSKRVRKQ